MSLILWPGGSAETSIQLFCVMTELLTATWRMFYLFFGAGQTLVFITQQWK